MRLSFFSSPKIFLVYFFLSTTHFNSIQGSRNCSDGTGFSCSFNVTCYEPSIAALQQGCYVCVDPVTCRKYMAPTNSSLKFEENKNGSFFRGFVVITSIIIICSVLVMIVARRYRQQQHTNYSTIGQSGNDEFDDEIHENPFEISRDLEEEELTKSHEYDDSTLRYY